MRVMFFSFFLLFQTNAKPCQTNSDSVGHDDGGLLASWTNSPITWADTGFLDMLHVQCQPPAHASQDEDGLGGAAVITTQHQHPSTSGGTAQSLGSPCSCLGVNQHLLDRLDRALRNPDQGSLDQILPLMQDVSRQLSEYRECPRCSSKGIKHLINMAMLLQSQMALLCAVTGNLSTILWPPDPGDREDAVTVAHVPRFTLGVYELTPEDDLDHKMLALVKMSRHVESQVNSFDDLVRAYQGMAVPDDFACINLQWLFKVASDLKSRLRVNITTLKRLEWAPMATESLEGTVINNPSSMKPSSSMFNA